MNSRFTDKAKSAIAYARAAASQLQHGYVGTEHLLVGLVQEKECIASIVLQANGVDEERLISLIHHTITPDGTVRVQEVGNYSPQAQAVLTNSEKEANRFQSQMIGTEHMLMAIIKDRYCTATRLLATMHVNIRKLYADLMHAAGEDPNYRGGEEGSSQKKTE